MTEKKPETKDDFPPLLKTTTRRMPTWKRVAYLVAAGLCFAAGIFGWLIPVMTGIPFYVAGAVFLALASDRFARWVNAAETRLPPKLRRALRKGAQKVPSRKVRAAVSGPESGGHD